MNRIIGCLTEISSRVLRFNFGSSKAMSVRVTVEQDWFLHATKGWRRGPKRKISRPVISMTAYPYWSLVKQWKSYGAYGRRQG